MKTANLLTILLFISSAAVVPAKAQDQKAGNTTEKKPAGASTPAPSLVYKNLSVEEFDKLRAEKDAVILDVRTEKEYKAGHIAGAVNIDVNAKGFEEQVAKLGKDKTLLVHCKAGVRSMRACKMLAPAGMTNLFNLEEGFDSWQKAGKPVEK